MFLCFDAVLGVDSRRNGGNGSSKPYHKNAPPIALAFRVCGWDTSDFMAHDVGFRVLRRIV